MLPCRCRTVLPCDCAEELRRRRAAITGKGEDGGSDTRDKTDEGSGGDTVSGSVSGAGFGDGSIVPFGPRGGTPGDATDEKGILRRLRFMFDRICNYLGPIGLWNAALALLLLGYYGKTYLWDTGPQGPVPVVDSDGTRGPDRVETKCPPKRKTVPPAACCASCKCFDRPRILKHRLKWPEDPKPCH